MTSMIEVRVLNGIGHLKLDRPKALNAINEVMVDEIEKALDAFEVDSDVRALIITGAGRAFCVGSDLKERSGDPRARIARMHRLVCRLMAWPKISVAAINGFALGGGLEIAMACTLRVAAIGARMGLPEVTHSLMPAYGGTQLLPRLVGMGRALELALSGEMVDAAKAERIGLINAVAENPVEAASALAEQCTVGGRLAQLEIRAAILSGIGLPLEQGLVIEAEAALRVGNSPEAKASLAAFAGGPH